MKQMDTNGGSIDRSICTPRVWSCLIQPVPVVPVLVQTVRPRQLSLAAALSPPLDLGSLNIHSESIRNSLKSDRVIQNPFKIHFKIHWHVKSMESTSKIQPESFLTNVQNYFDEIWKDMKRLVGFAKRIFACGWVCCLIDENRVEGSSLQVVELSQLRHRSCCLSAWCWTRQSGTWTAWTAHGSSPYFRSQLSGEYMENILAIACHSMSNEAWLWVLRIPSVFRAMNRP